MPQLGIPLTNVRLILGIVTVLGITASPVAANADAAQLALPTIPVQIQPEAIAINQTAQRAYVTNVQSQTVSVIDTVSETVIRETTVGDGPLSVAVNEITGKVYVPNWLNDSVSVLDAVTGEPIGTIPVAPRPTDIAVDTKTGKAYVTHSSSPNLTVLSGDSMEAVIDIGSIANSVAVDENSQQIYLAHQSQKLVTVIDIPNANTYVISVDSVPNAIGIDNTSHKAYVTHHDTGAVTVISGRSVLGSIDVGPYTHDVAVDQTSHTVYVTHPSSKRVSVINSATDAVTGTITTGAYPRGVAVDERTHKMYAVNLAANTVTVGAASTIASVSSAAGTELGGKRLTIIGSGFTGATQVNFGTSPGSNLTVISDTKIRITTPNHDIGAVDMSVITPDRTAILPSGFTYYPVTVVAALSPNAGSVVGGTTTILSGSGFTRATSIVFGNTPAEQFTIIDDTKISVTIPQHAATIVDVAVETPAETATLENAYTYYPAPISVTVAHATIRRGETQDAHGSGFQAGEKVTATMYSASSAAEARNTTVIGEGVAAPDGTITFTWVIASATEIKQHVIVLNGEKSRETSAAFLVTE